MALLIFLPVYLFFVCIALFAYKKMRPNSPDAEQADFKIRYAILGVIVSALITGVSIAQIEHTSSYAAYGSLFLQATLTVCVPAVFGIILALIYRVKFQKNSLLMSFTSGVLNSVYFIPLLAIGVAAYYDDVVNAPEYYSLCSDAGIEFKEQVEPVKGVLLAPDLFTNSSRGHPSDTRSIRFFLLNQTNLNFIEIPAKAGSDYSYERISTEGDRRVRTRGGEKNMKMRPIVKLKGQAETRFISTLSDSITSKYIVIPKRLNLPEKNKMGIGGSQIEIRRISDNRLIASAKYYWDDKTFKSCPNGVHDDLFPYRFIATALNVVNVDSSVKSMNLNARIH